MEVILLERVANLGQMGDIVSVKPGYARNYLLPQKKAQRATDENKKQFEAQKAQLEAANLEKRKEAEQVAAKMDGLSVILVRQAGEAGQLYGSVNARDVATQVTDAGFTVTRNQINLTDPIKNVGIYEVAVSLHPEVSVNVSVNVARSEAEAEIQAETGKAVVGSEEEEAEVAAEEIFEEEALEEAEASLAEAAAEEVQEEAPAEEVVEEAASEEAEEEKA